MKIKLENRRKFHRINFDAQVRLDCVGDQHNHCQIKNLSLTGMFVTGDFQQQQSKDCLISISHKTKSDKITLAASGTVVWGNDEGIGLKFTSMTHASYMLLVSTLINNAEQPSIVLHEFPKNSPFEITSI